MTKAAECGHVVTPTVIEMAIKPIEITNRRLFPGMVNSIQIPKREKVLFVPAVCDMCSIMREALQEA